MVSLSQTLKKLHFLTLELFLVFSAVPKGHFLQQGPSKDLIENLPIKQKVKNEFFFADFLE